MFYTSKVLTVVAAMIFAVGRVVLFGAAMIVCTYLTFGIPTLAFMDWPSVVEIGVWETAGIWVVATAALLAVQELFYNACFALPEWCDFAVREWQRPRPMRYAR